MLKVTRTLQQPDGSDRTLTSPCHVTPTDLKLASVMLPSGADGGSGSGYPVVPPHGIIHDSPAKEMRGKVSGYIKGICNKYKTEIWYENSFGNRLPRVKCTLSNYGHKLRQTEIVLKLLSFP